MTKERTQLQRDANSLDCDLFRLLCRAERLYADNRDAQKLLGDSLRGLRGARVGLRLCMHEQDRKETM
jgi:hypothetical protein